MQTEWKTVRRKYQNAGTNYQHLQIEKAPNLQVEMAQVDDTKDEDSGGSSLMFNIETMNRSTPLSQISLFALFSCIFWTHDVSLTFCW